MPNLTVRNIPDPLMEQLRAVSRAERRSLNNEILVLLEKGLKHFRLSDTLEQTMIPRDAQLSAWERLGGQWEDTRSTEEIIDDISGHRTCGRDVDL